MPENRGGGKHWRRLSDGDRHEWHMLKRKTNMKKRKLDEIGDWLEFRSSLA